MNQIGTKMQRGLWDELPVTQTDFEDWHREMKMRGLSERQITCQLKAELRR